ncbi:MAG: citrate transporter, partial [Oscillospiraceae bacterium]|nr:citrate transporter [Oscillospiraceae bacterium]
MAAQIVAIVIFVAMFLLLVTERIERHIVTMVCGALTVVAVFIVCLKDFGAAWDVLSFESFISPGFWYSTGHSEPAVGINWET